MSRPMLSPRAELMRLANQQVPLNALGLPQGFYRPDLLPSISPDSPPPCEQSGDAENLPAVVNSGVQKWNGGAGTAKGGAVTPSADSTLESLPSEVRDTVRTAYTPLSHAEGFPVLPDGRPFWSQLDFEPHEAFTAFEGYLEQGLRGARQLFILVEELKPRMNGNTPTLLELTEHFHLYSWAARTRSYDVCSAAAIKQQRALLAMDVESKHYLHATQLFNKLMIYMNSPEFMQSMSAKGAVDLLRTLIEWQRISTGLPARGISGTTEQSPVLETFETIMRQVAPTSEGSTINPVLNAQTELRKAILSNPETAGIA